MRLNLPKHGSRARSKAECDRCSQFRGPGSGGEAYALSAKAVRIPDDLAEHLQAQALINEAQKK